MGQHDSAPAACNLCSRRAFIGSLEVSHDDEEPGGVRVARVHRFECVCGAGASAPTCGRRGGHRCQAAAAPCDCGSGATGRICLGTGLLAMEWPAPRVGRRTLGARTPWRALGSGALGRASRPLALRGRALGAVRQRRGKARVAALQSPALLRSADNEAKLHKSVRECARRPTIGL